MYDHLDFDRDELSAVMRTTYDELIAFITTPNFRAMFDAMMALDPRQRPAFVSANLLSAADLARWGLVLPDGLLIQTSAFGDRRPTLFAVKKFLPKKYHRVWENLNWTFDNDSEKRDVPREPELCWRPPLPVGLQSAIMATGDDLQAVPVEAGVNADLFVPAVPAGFGEARGAA